MVLGYRLLISDKQKARSGSMWIGSRLWRRRAASIPMTSTPTNAPPVTLRHLRADELAAHRDATSGTPHYAVEHTSHSADLSVTVLNYGERQPGAETVLLRLSRAVDGLRNIWTTNGDAQFSPSGRLLALNLPFQVIVIDGATLQARHVALPNRTMLLGAKWDGERFVARYLAYGNASDAAETIGPLALVEIAQLWQAGLGPAARDASA